MWLTSRKQNTKHAGVNWPAGAIVISDKTGDDAGLAHVDG